MLRGLVMLLMMLDHARDFLYVGSVSDAIDPFDPAKSHWGLYATRWITHLCAPTFVFLSGVSIFLQKEKGKASLSYFLFSRGLWLLFLEITLINFGWTFLPPFQLVFIQVIGAIGLSMVAMGFLIRMPAGWVGALGITYLLIQHFLVGIIDGKELEFPWYEVISFRGGSIEKLPFVFYVPYPFLPWLAIMATGFGLGTYFSPGPNRKPSFTIAKFGLGGIALFFGLRMWNAYGDRLPWKAEPLTRTFWYEFWDVSKYPPSLQYVLATLAISFVLYWILDRWAIGGVKKFLLTFGRVPLFFYVLHLFAIHTLAILLYWMEGLSLSDLGKSDSPFGIPRGYGYSLPMLYLICIFLAFVLYFPCNWFMNVKAKYKGAWWVSYT
jgi:uncharacterized membrane protein